MSEESKDETQRLIVKEFSVQASAFFREPILRAAAKIPEIVTACLKSKKLGSLINPQEVKIVGDELFNYSLQISIANGVVAILLGSEELRVNYSKGNTQHQLQLIVDLVDTAFEVGLQNPTSHYEIAYSFHSEFEAPGAFARYNERFANSEIQVNSGGVILAGTGRLFEGTARLSLERSLVYPNGLFGHFTVSTREKLNLEVAQKIDKRFAELFQSQGFELRFPT